jgi:hypothetical protein
MDQVYLSETIDTIKAELDYTIRTDRAGQLAERHQVNAMYRSATPPIPNRFCSAGPSTWSPDQPIVHTPGEDLRISERSRSAMPIMKRSPRILSLRTGWSLSITLSLRLTVQAEVLLAGGETILIEEPELLFPAAYTKTVNHPGRCRSIRRSGRPSTRRYAINCASHRLPLAVYLVVADWRWSCSACCWVIHARPPLPVSAAVCAN